MVGAGTRLVLGRDMIFMSWHGQPWGVAMWSRRLDTEAAWKLEIGVATHYLVSRYGLANLVLRHTFWCHDIGERLGCRDIAFGVAIGKLHCGLKWGCDTFFGVATQS